MQQTKWSVQLSRLFSGYHDGDNKKVMQSIMNTGWELLLKRMSTGLHRSQPRAAGSLVSFPPKRQKKLAWNLFLCGCSRWRPTSQPIWTRGG